MIQFWHEVFRDHQAIEKAATQGSYEDFVKIYKRVDLKIVFGRTNTLLSLAVTNKDIESRIKIVTKLLDDGADPNFGSVLLAYMVAREHDFKKEQPLLERLIERGADINKPSDRWGRPLLALSREFRLKEAVLLPFYDVFFAQPNLDLVTKSGPPKHSYSAYNQIQKIIQKRPILLERADAYLTAHNIPKPDDAL